MPGNSRRPHLQFVIFLVAIKFRLDKTGQAFAFFNRHSLLIIYFHDNGVIAAHTHIYNKEALFIGNVLFNNLSYNGVFYHQEKTFW